MTLAYLGLGSNTHAERNFSSALKRLRADFPGLELSPVYRSRSVGFEGEDFLNAVAAVRTIMSPAELRLYLRKLEDDHGRVRNVPKFSDRTLDIDILLFGDLVLDSPELELPRPEILRFAHVLRPLADLAPDRLYPGTDQTIGELWLAMAPSAEHVLEPEPGDW